jgi:hypothetical protein
MSNALMLLRQARPWLGWGVLINGALLIGLLSVRAAKSFGWEAASIIETSSWLAAALGVVLVYILSYMSWGLLRQHRPCDLHLRGQRLPPSPKLSLAAAGLVPPGHLFQLDSDIPFAGCIGLWRPAIYLSTGLVTKLSPQALRAAIAHEEAHRRRRDPLRFMAWRIISRELIPSALLTKLAERSDLRAEILADRFARSRVSTASLATALLLVIRDGAFSSRTPVSDLRAFPSALNGSMTASEQLGKRLHYLTLALNAPLPVMFALPKDETHLDRPRLLTLAGILVVVITLSQAALVMSIGPLRLAFFCIFHST